MRWIALMLLMVFLAGALEACAAQDLDSVKPTIKGKGGFSGFKSSSKKLKKDPDDDGDSGGWWLLAAIVIVLIVVVVLVYIFFTRRGSP